MKREPVNILFVCIGNMCRSPMAEGFARARGGDDVVAWSAGIRPTGVVSHDAILAMEEIGIDISRQRSKGLDEIPVESMDVVVSMAPVPAARLVPKGFAGRTIDWPVPDPVGGSLRRFRDVRDEIGRRVSALLAELGVPGRR